MFIGCKSLRLMKPNGEYMGSGGLRGKNFH